MATSNMSSAVTLAWLYKLRKELDEMAANNLPAEATLAELYKLHSELDKIATNSLPTKATLAELYKLLREVDEMSCYVQKELCEFSIIDPALIDPPNERIFIYNSWHWKLEESRTLLRRSVDVSSRSSVRPLNLLDLPDELLTAIFKMVKDQDERGGLAFKPHSAPEREVMNLRLTCRRFHDCSSHLLLRFIRVELSTTSISHLEEVANHSSIRRGIRAVEFNMLVYNYAMANDINLFAEHKTKHITSQLIDLQRMDGAFRSDKMKNEAVQNLIRIGNDLVKSWEYFRENISTTDEELLRFQNMLKGCHAEYQKRFAEQEDLWRSGVFMRRVAAALATLPNAKSFLICDEDLHIVHHTDFFHNNVNQYEGLIQNIVTPNGFTDSKFYEWGPPPFEVLLQFPSILHQAGVVGFELDYAMVWENLPSIPALSPKIFQDLKIASQNLKLLAYGCEFGSGTNVPQPENLEQAYALKRILNSFLSSDSLELIEVTFGFLLEGRDQSLQSSLYTYVFPRNFPNLRGLSLSSFSVHFTELQAILRSNPSLKFVSLVRPFLLSGTWKEALQVLRVPSDSSWRHLDSPMGAECTSLSSVKYAAIFGLTGQMTQSVAEDFLRRLDIRNPLEEGTVDLVDVT